MTRNTTAWLSSGFEELASQPLKARQFDVVIVGSGYGGAIAAEHLAGLAPAGSGRPLRIAVLERGNEYLPGAFPAHWGELPKHVRVNTGKPATKGVQEGVFDFRLGKHVTALLANGLGGGSLINAGVMIEPHAEVFQTDWPKGLKAGLSGYFDAARGKLLSSAAGDDSSENPKRSGTATGEHRQALQNLKPNEFRVRPQKMQRMEALAVQAGREFVDADICVNLNASHSDKIVRPCIECGDCATGCNYGAKKSLDTNLLVAAAKHGAELYTGATVLRFRKSDALTGWELDVTHTNQRLKQRQSEPVRIVARQLIIAAGSYGSTELLMRSETQSMSFSIELGNKFSANGDMIAAGYPRASNPGYEVNAIADERLHPRRRKVGPTITGVISLPPEKGRPRLMVQELAAPGSVGKLFSELATTGNFLHQLSRPDRQKHVSGRPKNDPASVNQKHIAATSIYAVFGDDGANGKFQLAADHSDFALEQGGISVEWPELPKHPLFDAQIEALQELAPDEVIIPNPGWRALPKDVAYLANNAVGPLLSVHPLGGCRMADSVYDGVVNEFGQVFNPDGGLYDGLLVLDGSIVPSSLGANPALTITALAIRAMEHVCQSFKPLGPVLPAMPRTVTSQRPWFRDVERMYDEQPETFAPPATRCHFTERLNGALTLKGADGRQKNVVAELTLDFEPISLPELYEHSGSFVLKLSGNNSNRPTVSRLRIYTPADWQQLELSGLSGAALEQLRDRICSVNTTLHGRMHLFEREASTVFGRVVRAGSTWFRMRGLRDMVLGLKDGKVAAENLALADVIATRLKSGIGLASRGGEVRLMRYELVIGKTVSCRDPELQQLFTAGQKIQACKRLSYKLFSNPWRQLTELPLTVFPRMTRSGARLSLDYSFMLERGQPLFRIHQQHDQATALGELGQWGFYLLRLLAGLHVWTLRSADKPRDRNIHRLPQLQQHIPSRWTKRFIVDHYLDNNGKYQPAAMQLTRYPKPNTDMPPVLCIHGYSASGTTYAHPAIKNNLAQRLHCDGSDVWILDMRGSPDIEGSGHNWAMEDLAYVDIPLAIDWLVNETGSQQVDVVAHCMGAAMVSMAILSADDTDVRMPDSNHAERLPDARKKVPDRIRRVVMSQVGPTVVPTPLNRLRGYLASYLLQRKPDVKFSFRPDASSPLAMQALDRVLAAQDYPLNEMRTENPLLPWKRVEHVGSRRRLDGLYGRVFELDQLADETLLHLDDFFGPTNLETIAQAAHFSRWLTITGRDGFNHFVSRDRLQKHWKIPTLYLHGEKNGMMAPANADRMQWLFNEAGMGQWLQAPKIYSDSGHQDLWIGKNTEIIFDDVQAFLESSDEQLSATSVGAHDRRSQRIPDYFIRSPHSGPVIGRLEDVDNEVSISFGLPPGLMPPAYVLFTAVAVHAENQQLSWPHGVGKFSGENVFVCRLNARGMRAADIDWIGTAVPRALFKQPDCNAVLVTLLYEDLTDECASKAQDNEPLPRGDGFSLPQPLQPLSFAEWQSDEARYTKVLSALQREQEKASEHLLSGIVQPKPSIVEESNPTTSGTVTVAFGSCQYPRGLLDQKPAAAAWKQLSERLDSDSSADMVLLLGDQIYTDASAGLFDPVNLDDRFAGPYQRLYGEPAVISVLSRVPAAMMLDDHEIIDNWEPDARDSLPAMFSRFLSHSACESAFRELPPLRELASFRPYREATEVCPADSNGKLRAIHKIRCDRNARLNRLLGILLSMLKGHDSTIVNQFIAELAPLLLIKNIAWRPLQPSDDSSYARRGITAYLKYQRSADKRLVRSSQHPYESVFDVPLHYAFRAQGISVFMVNSRTERQGRNTELQDGERARIISETQMLELQQWLLDLPPEMPKLVASPSVFLPRHNRAQQGPSAWLHSDGWDGFPQCQAELLRFIADHNIQNIIFLSGDEHLGIGCQATLFSPQAEQGKQYTTVMSLHSTALYAPYPFANARPEDLLPEEEFAVLPCAGSDQPLVCEVQSLFQRGQGFTELQLERTQGVDEAIRWGYSCEFLCNSGAPGARLQWGDGKGLHCLI